MLNNVLVKPFCTLQEFYEALKNPQLGLYRFIDEFAAPLYYEEMKLDRLESEVRVFLGLSCFDVYYSLQIWI